MVRRLHVFTCVALVLLGGERMPAAAQATASAPAALAVDVWVRDAQQQPAADLEPDDFEVQLDGVQRPVTTARFIEYAPVSPAATPAGITSAAELPGRTIGIVIDDLSLVGDQATRLRDAAARWVSDLHSSGRVAVFRSEETGTTGDAEFVRERRTLGQVEAIASAVTWLVAAPGPRVLVFVSEGVVMSPEATRYLSTSVGLARDAGISTYVVAPAATPGGAAGAPPAASWDSDPVESPALLAAGLDQLAASMRGRVVRGDGTFESAFADVGRQLSGFYRLEIDVPADDVLPRSLPVSVAVRPSDLAVHTAARVAPPTALTVPRTMEERRRDILAGVDAAADIDFDATTVLLRDPASPDQLQLVVSLILPADLPAPVRASLGLLDEGGTVRVGSTDVGGTTGGPLQASIAIGLVPGWHRLTLLVEDGQGRLGSIGRAVHARLRSIGGFGAAEPRVIWRAGDPGWQMLGGDRLPDEAVAAAAVFEFYPGTAGRELPPLPLRLEDGAGMELATQALTPTPLAHGWRLSSEVQLEGLEPGEYVVQLDMTPLDASAAPLEVRFRKDTAATASRAAASAPPPLPDRADLLNLFRAGVRDDWPPFAADDLLTRDLLMPQLEALSGSGPLPVGLVDATGDDDWWAALRTAGGARTVLGRAALGLAALHDGDATAAVAHLRDAASDNPTSQPLRRLLGLAYAASGRDDAAAGVWSLATDGGGGDARWSLAYAEALGRVGDFATTLLTLNDIPGEPPDRAAHRIVDTLLVLGRMDEATQMLIEWEAGEGRDQPTARRAFYLVVLRYAAALEPGAGATTVEDFRRAAEAYVAGGGEYADMIAPWIQSIPRMEAR